MSIYTYNAHLVKVVDADTVDLLVDLGFNVKMEMRVRLMGIDAPERFTDEGKEATRFVKAHLECYKDKLILETFKDKQGKYGRYLGVIYRGNIDKISLNDELLEKGYAVEYGKKDKGS